jgi:hypothetical protein
MTQNLLKREYEQNIEAGNPYLMFFCVSEFLKFKGESFLKYFDYCEEYGAPSYNGHNGDYAHFQNYAKRLGGIAYGVTPTGRDCVFFSKEDQELTAFLLVKG